MINSWLEIIKRKKREDMYQICACIELYQWRFGYPGSQFGFEIFFASQKFELLGGCHEKVSIGTILGPLTSREPAERRYAP